MHAGSERIDRTIQSNMYEVNKIFDECVRPRTSGRILVRMIKGRLLSLSLQD